tara:strand:+ start:2887 stop:3723 length:837 start_codon:yes stop_codon:yes gene_type:complete
MKTKLMDQFKLEGKKALVTGGGSGMGLEFTRILAEAGATVMIAARNEKRLKAAADEITSETGSKVHYRKVDLSDRREAETLILDAQKIMGGLDIFVGNAAMDMFSTVETFDEATYEKMMSVNFDSNMWMTRAAVPAMKKNRWGRIIYISSLASSMGHRHFNLGLYSSSKAALEGYARYAAVELGAEGITVNVIAPGSVKTPMMEASVAAGFADASKEERDAVSSYITSLIPLNRLAQPHELAGMVLLLASDAGSYITGVRYVIDGGWTIMGDTMSKNK